MKRPFTLIETLVVLVILMLVMGTVMPAVLRVPRRILVENAQTGLVSALRECGVRALAGGLAVEARLDPSGRRLHVTAKRGGDGALGESRMPAGSAPRAEDGMLVSSRTSYPLPEGIDWEIDNLDFADEPPTFRFHPDGTASGPELVFVVARRRFILWVDRLTGRPGVRELDP